MRPRDPRIPGRGGGGALPSLYPAAAEVLSAILVLEQVEVVWCSVAGKLISRPARSSGPADGLAARCCRPST